MTVGIEETSQIIPREPLPNFRLGRERIEKRAATRERVVRRALDLAIRVLSDRPLLYQRQ